MTPKFVFTLLANVILLMSVAVGFFGKTEAATYLAILACYSAICANGAK
jgi:hypothetical protein